MTTDPFATGDEPVYVPQPEVAQTKPSRGLIAVGVVLITVSVALKFFGVEVTSTSTDSIDVVALAAFVPAIIGGILVYVGLRRKKVKFPQ